MPEKQYLAWRNKVTSDQGIDSQVAAVEVAKVPRVNPEYLKQLGGITAGENVNTEDLSHAAQRMSALDDIDSVSYELKGDPSHATLEWLPYVKSWGPDFLKVDLGMFASASGDNRGFVLYLQHERTWIDDLGGAWRNEIQLGTIRWYPPVCISRSMWRSTILLSPRRSGISSGKMFSITTSTSPAMSSKTSVDELTSVGISAIKRKSASDT